jgi:hypothetical protein
MLSPPEIAVQRTAYAPALQRAYPRVALRKKPAAGELIDLFLRWEGSRLEPVRCDRGRVIPLDLIVALAPAGVLFARRVLRQD